MKEDLALWVLDSQLKVIRPLPLSLLRDPNTGWNKRLSREIISALSRVGRDGPHECDNPYRKAPSQNQVFEERRDGYHLCRNSGCGRPPPLTRKLRIGRLTPILRAVISMDSNRRAFACHPNHRTGLWEMDTPMTHGAPVSRALNNWPENVWDAAIVTAPHRRCSRRRGHLLHWKRSGSKVKSRRGGDGVVGGGPFMPKMPGGTKSCCR